MDVVSTCRFPVASLIWQPRPDAWVLTVVCKATYLLLPGVCTLAPTQEPTLDEDRHWGDDPARSLRCPRDLVPVKPGADVILVGHAFAPDRRPVRSLDARLSVGEIDKAIEVSADRTVRPDGSVREGQPFTQSPLVYERTGGGPGTWNPVCVRREARDAEGGVVLPNLHRLGASLQNVFEPVGFGPISAAWPERRDRLGAAGAAWSFQDLAQRPLPEGMDLAFFNAAPRDQQLRTLGDRLRLSLDNLHPEHPQLVTSLSTTAPRAVLEGRREGPLAITLRADTLWIDTDHGLCTLTFRGMVPLQSAGEKGRVVVSTDADRPQAEPAPAPRAAGELPAVNRAARRYEMTADIPLAARQGAKAALPFAPSAAAFVPAAAQAVQAPAAPPVVQQAPEPPVSVLPPAPLPVSPWAPGGHGLAAPALAALPLMALAAAPAVSSSGSVFDASTAAAGELRPAASFEPPPSRPMPAVEPEPAARVEAPETIELVWFDPEGVPRARRKAAWRPLLDALERAPLDPDFDDPAFAKDPMLVEDRREIFEILAHAAPLDADGLDAALGRCRRDDGKFVPVLALFAGELELPFDELAVMRATLTTVSPLVGSDEALKSAVQAARDFLATPGLMSAPAVAEGLTRRMEDAFAQGKRVVPSGYLEAQRERALLEQRQYQRRAVFGGKHLRTLLKLGGAEPAGGAAAGIKPGAPGRSPPGGAGALVPAYLPESLAEALPMYPRFRVRVVAEIRLPADRHETHPAALRVLAMARVELNSRKA
jgi:hypothetical protein